MLNAHSVGKEFLEFFNAGALQCRDNNGGYAVVHWRHIICEVGFVDHQQVFLPVGVMQVFFVDGHVCFFDM